MTIADASRTASSTWPIDATRAGRRSHADYSQPSRALPAGSCGDEDWAVALNGAEEPFRLELHGDVAIARPVGRIALERAIARYTATIEAARRRGIRKMLLVTTGLEGLRPPDGTRAFLARQWATAAGGAVSVAIVACAELRDPQRIGVIVAKNYGMNTEVFSAEADALNWLARIR